MMMDDATSSSPSQKRTDNVTAIRDVIIIGGGAGGMACATYAGRAELDTLLIEREGIGGQVVRTHFIENYMGFPDGITGFELAQRMEAQARKFGARFVREEVVDVRVDGDEKIVTTSAGIHRSRVLILAVGSRPRTLDVPGEKEFIGKGVSYCGTCDGPFFRDKRIVAVGGGDVAFKEDLFLTRFASEVTLVHRRDVFRAEKLYQTAVMENPKIKPMLWHVVQRISGSGKVEAVDLRNVKTQDVVTLPCDGVFVFIGRQPNTAFLKGILPDEAGEHIATDANMMTSVPGVYAIGDARGASRYQIATAVGEGAVALMAAEEWIVERRAGA